MAWARSGWHNTWLWDCLGATGTSDATLSHTMRAALFDNTVTPDGTSPAPMARYGTGQWASGEVTDPPGWPAGGLVVPGVAAIVGGGTAEAVIAGGAVTAAGPATLLPFGDMVYDSVNTDEAGLAFCFHNYGGPVPVNAGSFTITWQNGWLAVIISRTG
jgi:hypothetical protein